MHPKTMSRLFSLLLALALCACVLGISVSAAEGPAASSNIDDHFYINAQRWTDPINSTLYPEDGGFVRVEHINGSLMVERYDADFRYLSGQTLELELPIYGGVYIGTDYNFVVVGQNNYDEDDSVEVFRIIRYSKDWVRQASCGLFGANTIEPFQGGSVRFDRCGDYLYIRTAHKMYADENGTNHQANVMINVRVSDMAIADSYTDVLNRNYGYISHSFNQFVRVDGTDLLAVDHGDALPRSVVLIKYNKPAGQDSFFGRVSYVNALPIVASSYHYNDTGVSVGGFECSSTDYLIAGCSYDGTESIDLMYAHRNIFVTATPKDDFTDEGTTVHWLTDFTAADGVTVSPPHLVKLSNDCFFLIWTEDGEVKYCCLDGKGQLNGEITAFDGDLSDCVPIYTGDRIVWYVTNNSAPVFYEIPFEIPHDHDYTCAITEATCTEDGSAVYTCTICGHTYTETIPATGHSFVDDLCVCGAYGGTTGVLPEVLDWVLIDGTLTISGKGGMPNYSNPTIQPWYPYLDRITAIVLEEGVTAIGTYAFEGHYAVSSVSLPDSLKEVRADAFKDCTALTEMTFPDSVTTISAWAMDGCTALERVRLSENIDTLYGFTFHNCTSLTEVQIPDSVTRIVNSVFEGCTALTEITIPASVESIDTLAFADSGLRSVTFLGDPPTMSNHPTYGTFLNVIASACYPAGNSAWTGTALSGYGGSLYWYDSDSLPSPLPAPGDDSGITSGTFGSVHWHLNPITGVLSINGTGELGGFSSHDNQPWREYADLITRVVVGEGITVLGSHAFEGLPALETVSLPDGLLEVQIDVFQDCTALKEVRFPDTVTTISAWAMDSCTGLERVHLPAGMTMIYAFTLSDCPNLVHVNIPDGVTTIKNNAFENSAALEQIVIPASVKSIETLAFANSGLERIYFQGDAPSIGSDTFKNVRAAACYPSGNATWTETLMSSYGGELTWAPYSGQLAGGTVGSGLRWSLDECGKLTISGSGAMKNFTYKSEMPWYAWADRIYDVVIEEGVTAIGDYAFYGMPNLETISIPKDVTYIGAYAFKNCTALSQVNLPAGLTKLGESAFYGCSSLTAIDIPASLWTVQPYTFKNCTSLLSVTFHEGNLQKISDGAFYNTALTTVKLPDCLTILDSYTFKNCADLAAVKLSAGLTQIREACLYGTAISEITIPEGVTVIKPYAFKNCRKLSGLTLPAGLVTIGEASFYNCASLDAFVLPGSVTTIDDYAFRNCTSLTVLERDGTGPQLQSVGMSSFQGCTSLVSFATNQGFTTVGDYAFKNCTSLAMFTMYGTEKTLGDSAFYGCTGLESIVICEGTESIGDYCFAGCAGLRDIHFFCDAPAIGPKAFARVTANAHYSPVTNSGWTADVLQNYGGTLTWVNEEA